MGDFAEHDDELVAAGAEVNQEVRALTVVALIFMPATLISRIFGMNFISVPLLDLPTGFLIALGLMAMMATTLSLVFWRRRWLGYVAYVRGGTQNARHHSATGAGFRFQLYA